MPLRARVRFHLARTFLLAAFAIPVTEPKGWEVLQFRSIKPNVVQFGPSGLRIEVKNSASPVVYKLPRDLRVKEVQLEVAWQGAFSVPAGQKQGENKVDDFLMRVGLVLSGDRRLSFAERWVAPEWVRRLHQLAPPDKGIDSILFLNLIQDPRRLGEERQHPASRLLRERMVWGPIPPNGPRSLTYRLPSPVSVTALWLSCDGDDLNAEFTVQLQRLVLIEEVEPSS